MILTPLQEAALRRVLRAARELEAAQLELSRALGVIESDDRELEAFLMADERPSLSVIQGGLSAERPEAGAIRSAGRAHRSKP